MMNPRNTLIASTLLAASLASASTHAVEVHWVLDGVVLSDGQTLTGSFDHDEDASIFSNVAITNSGNSFWAPQVFSAAVNPSPWYQAATFHDGSLTTGNVETLLRLLPLFMTHPYSASGVLALDTSEAVFMHCSAGVQCPGSAWASGAEITYVVSGQIVAVPEAETYAMMLTGLGLVGFMARRRKQLEA